MAAMNSVGVVVLIVFVLAATYHCLDASDTDLTYDVAGTNLTAVNLTTMNLLYNYKCVNLSNNIITNLDENTFSQQWNVQTLDLSNNLILELSPLLFKTLIALQYLNVTHNRLTSIPSTLFQKTSWLKIIDLSYNDISEVPLSVFNYGFVQLELVNLSHNSLTSFEPWNYVRPGVKSRHFDLRWNNIFTFTNHYNLSIADDSRSTPYDLITNDVRHNSLRQWQNLNFSQYFESEISIENALLCMLIDLRDNPWMCDCHMFPLVQPMSHSPLKYSKNSFTMIRCQDPPPFKNKRIFFDLHTEDFVCNITQSCPETCLCQDRPTDRVLNIDCRGKNLTKIPITFPESPYGKTELDLDDNHIERLESLTISKQIVKLSMNNNRLAFLNGSIIKAIASQAKAAVDFRNNLLTSVPEEMTSLQHTQTKLIGNRLECSCSMMWMVTWLSQPPKPKLDEDVLTCMFKGDIYTITKLDDDILGCRLTDSLLLMIILAGVLALVIILLLTAKRCPYETKVLLFKIFRIHPADKYTVDENNAAMYDMYVSFDEEDPYLRQWVKRVLVRKLEMNKPFYRLCLSCKHLSAGPEADARLDLIEQSKRMLIVLSEGFDGNQWCSYESSQSECLENIEGRIIYLLYDDHAARLASEEPWKSRIHGRKCFKISERMMWSKLRYELPVKPASKR